MTEAEFRHVNDSASMLEPNAQPHRKIHQAGQGNEEEHIKYGVG
jgi:hypothetical protein